MDDIVSYAFDFFAVCAFLAMFYCLWGKRKSEFIYLALLFVFCSFMGNPHRIKKAEVSKSGIELEAQEVINQVQVTLAQLQKITVASAEANLTGLAMSGQMFSGINTEYKFEIHNRIIDSLKAIGVSDEEIHGTQGVWISVYGRLILNHIEGIAAKLLPNEKAGEEIEGLPKDSNYDLPTPQVVRGWIMSKSLNDPDLSQFVDEYQNIWATGDMKNPKLIPFNETFMH